jgi:hypothetical protein
MAPPGRPGHLPSTSHLYFMLIAIFIVFIVFIMFMFVFIIVVF